ncbi:unnamed protein product, partial [marine sediment metagenome]
ITLPMPIVKTLGIEEKDELEIWLDDSHIIMQKPEKTRAVETMDSK